MKPDGGHTPSGFLQDLGSYNLLVAAREDAANTSTTHFRPSVLSRLYFTRVSKCCGHLEDRNQI
jgi:hypothetical protein